QEDKVEDVKDISSKMIQIESLVFEPFKPFEDVTEETSIQDTEQLVKEEIGNAEQPEEKPMEELFESHIVKQKTDENPEDLIRNISSDDTSEQPVVISGLDDELTSNKHSDILPDINDDNLSDKTCGIANEQTLIDKDLPTNKDSDRPILVEHPGTIPDANQSLGPSVQHSPGGVHVANTTIIMTTDAPPLSPDTNTNDNLKKVLSKDVEEIARKVKSIEEEVTQLPMSGFKEMLEALERIKGDLRKYATDAIQLERIVMDLPSDADVQALAAHLAGIRTRIATLLSQAENGTSAVSAAHAVQQEKEKELLEYQVFLTEIETWLKTMQETLIVDHESNTEEQLQREIELYTRLTEDLDRKRARLSELTKSCESFKKYPDLVSFATSLLEQLRHLVRVFEEQENTLRKKIDILRKTLMKMEEDVQKGVSIETQTGKSLDLTQYEPYSKDVETQAQISQSTSQTDAPKSKETISIHKTISGAGETIQIATKPVLQGQQTVEKPDDILVTADYSNKPEALEGKLEISHVIDSKPFETVMVEPDETTTEVIVDADGTKRIIVKKLHRTLVQRHQTVQREHITRLGTVTQGSIPISQSFSQVTLQGQQSSTTVQKGDQAPETVTTESARGQIVTGLPSGEIRVERFESPGRVDYSQEFQPREIEVHGVKLHEGDITFIEDGKVVVPTSEAIKREGDEIHTSSSSVRAVVQQVTRRIIRKTRRIIRKVVIVDGKEQVTEEIIEEPEEIEVTEEGIPRVSINVTQMEDGVVKEQQYGEPLTAEQVQQLSSSGVTLDTSGKPVVTQLEEQRYVVEPTIAREPVEAQSGIQTVEIISERPSTETTTVETIEKDNVALRAQPVVAPSSFDAPQKPEELFKDIPSKKSSGIEASMAFIQGEISREFDNYQTAPKDLTEIEIETQLEITS
ncbi:hypothetical protein AMK59_3689, partial [Oryctes borbonicus]